MVILIYSLSLLIARDELISSSEYWIGILKLTVPPATSWYIKIQILAYIFHLFTYKITQGKETMLMTVIMSIYTVAMFISGAEDFWWTSAICYSIGIFAAKKKESIKELISRRLILPILLLITICSYMTALKLHHGAIFMCMFGVLAIAAISSRITINSKLLTGCGKMTFELYLTQVMMIYLILRQGFNLNLRVIIYLAGSIVLAIGIESVVKLIMRKTGEG